MTRFPWTTGVRKALLLMVKKTVSNTEMVVVVLLVVRVAAEYAKISVDPN